MYKLFVVEDDPGIAKSICAEAESWNFDTFCVKNFQGVIESFKSFEPHIVLMDIALPFFNGYYWCGEIRKISNVPVIFLSSASDNMNIVMAINMGADDFISKPFDKNILMAKINALLRRAYNYVPEIKNPEHKGARLNTDDNSLTFNGQKISLTKNEYRILFCLLENKSRIVSREKLMETLWATDIFVDDNTLTVNINRLRKKLDSAGLNNFITTKVGTGYIIE